MRRIKDGAGCTLFEVNLVVGEEICYRCYRWELQQKEICRGKF
ncbi:hypothetical protein PATY110618_11190 [Paenibacillus typhae]|uniref:Uncharacterized protein n=1 Tax=Paenibacillus typhae TaxID=1174501 RepID=A0A1G9AW70_9BACL|nr:hypothetical protein SAMN05216192_1387 [Paenibacillus typhae]